MNRNTPIIWSLLSTLLCGWPGICVLSLGIPSLITQPQFRSTNVFLVLFGLIMLAFPITIVFRNFRSSTDSGIRVLGLVTGLLGLLQLGTAFIYLIGAGAATNTTGIWEAVVSLSVSGLLLGGVSILIWFIRVNRKPKEDVVNKPLAPVVYRSVSAENDPGYTNSTKIMLVALAIVIIMIIIAAFINN